MNVLPVLADPTSSPDLPAERTASSVGEFARIFNKTLAGPSSGGGVSGLSHLARPSAPRQRQEGAAGQSAHESHSEAANRAGSPADSAAKGSETKASRSQRAGGQGSDGARHDSAAKSASSDGSAKATGTKAASKKQASGAGPKNASHPAGATKASASTGAEKSKHSSKPSRELSASLLLAGTPKEMRAVLTKAVERAAAAAKRAAKSVAQSGESASHGEKAVAKTKGTVEKQKKGAAVAPPNTKRPKKGKEAHPAAVQSKLHGGLGLQQGTLVAANQQGAPAQGAATASAQTNAPPPQPEHANQAQPQTGNANAQVTIVDLRQGNQSGKTSGDSGGKQQQPQQSNQAANVRLFQLAEGGPNGSPLASGQAGRAGAPPPAGNSFQAMTDQIVKQTGILLKNDNAGEIRLVLKPEHLGKLRIKINMVNNNLAGKIFVQNHEALRLVQQNLASLYRALRDSGFTTTQLNVSVGGREQEERSKDRPSPLPSVRAIQGVSGFDTHIPGPETMSALHSMVNLVI